LHCQLTHTLQHIGRLVQRALSRLQQVHAIVQVIRCFEDDDIHHVSGHVDPVRDIEVINTELILADITSLTKRNERLQKAIRVGDKAAKAESAVIEKLLPHLNEGKPALIAELSDEEKKVAREFFLLTNKPTIFACNVSEADLAATSSLMSGTAGAEAQTLPAAIHVQAVQKYAASHFATGAVVISAQIESELVDLPEEDAREYLSGLGVQSSGVGSLIRAVYHLLGLRTYLTTGEQETRAWTIRSGDKAPAECAGPAACSAADATCAAHRKQAAHAAARLLLPPSAPELALPCAAARRRR
jgi:ribosome-binding ATPase YchF (GTP1/OBG family)